ncbi:hypothetical protein A9Z54_12315 [Acinetobacter sp. 51m]|jgi:hypothetical protein|nr:hypothetical protein A9Z54_12315 [Acinetobacter sp. 51m]
MEYFLFSIGDIFAFFDADKAVTLVFDLRSVEEATNTEEAGLFCHLVRSTFTSLKYVVIKRFIENTVKRNQEKF